MNAIVAAAAACSALITANLAAETAVPSIFSDHMVVQQKTPLRVFGTDAPMQTVAVSFAGQQATAKADAQGKWTASIPVPPAGGPYELTIRGSSEKTIKDVLVGEVWVCSGQSNMQWSVGASLNGAQEVAQADYPNIRLYNVPNVRSVQPQPDVKAAWAACSPRTVGGFSAVGYFFGRDLHRQLNVPIGLINSSWGGTAAEAWTPREELSTLPGMREMLEASQGDQATAWKKHGAALNAWLAELGIRNEAGPKAEWAAPAMDDSAWKSMELPVYWQSAGLAGNGIVWFRKVVEIPTDAKLDEATLELGGVDDFDVTFVNGQQVGKTEGDTPSFWSAPRKYAVPAGLLKVGANTIAVRVVDFGGNGGFAGPATAMKLTVGGRSVSLAGAWKYQLEQEIVINTDKPRPAQPAGDMMATELYNAMIHPFVGFPIAGAIWYQGETNSGNPAMYQKLLPTMIGAWRERWGQQFPFLIVQLAGFMTDSGKPSDNSGWPVFRDVQRKIAEETPKSGLALAIDIGDRDDIHPKNKQEVGRRLALQAMKVAYGKDVVASGPTIKGAKADGAKAVLSFENVGGGLVAKDGNLAKNFALQDRSGTWVWADAKIEGNTVVLSSPQVSSPAMVRYAWQNTPPASLYNKENLPAVPFQVEVK